jgi:uncharacterized protein YciI
MFSYRRNGTLLLLVVAFTAAIAPSHGKPETQASSPSRQYVVLLKPGPGWIQGKSVSEQPLVEHGKYLQELMNRRSLQLAGPFLDNSGGLVLLNAADESEARQIVEHDPGVVAQLLQLDTIRPFHTAFDATTGKSPFTK